MDKPKYPHLDPHVQPLADAEAGERILDILAERFIPHRAAAEILAFADYLVSSPTTTPPSALLVTGTPGAGTGMLSRAIERSYGLVPASESSPASQPILRIEMTDVRDKGALFERALFELRVPVTARLRAKNRESEAIALMRLARTRVLLLDGFHDLIHATAPERRQVINAVKLWINALGLSVIAFGTSKAEDVLTCDPELHERCRHRVMPTWTVDDELRELLRGMERSLPLRKPSHLDRDKVMRRLVALSGGSLGRIMYLLAHAGVAGVRSGNECIDVEAIEHAAVSLPQGPIGSWGTAPCEV